jgi:murein L,D-transpeptidase YcbB/YkuD
MVADAGYLGRKNYEIVTVSGAAFDGGVSASELRRGALRIRQRPGPLNSLGRVKFIFPNRFDVYLHDTPEGRLFARARRDFSHGCVRVARPAELADWALRGAWPPERIAAAMRRGEEQHVRLAESIPVYIVYRTAWVDAQRVVQFRRDIYGLDAALSRALDGAAPLPQQLQIAREAPTGPARVDRPDIIAGYGSGASGVGTGLGLRAARGVDPMAIAGGGAVSGGDDTGSGTF